MQLNESARAWAMVIGVIGIILANLTAIILMNLLGR